MKKKMFKFISCITILFMVSCSGDDLLFSYEDDVTTRGLSGRASLTYPMSSFISNVSLSLTDQGSVNSILEELQSNPLGKGYRYNPQIQISAESETKRSIFREKDKTKRSKKESAQHSKSRNKSFVMTSVSAL